MSRIDARRIVTMMADEERGWINLVRDNDRCPVGANRVPCRSWEVKPAVAVNVSCALPFPTIVWLGDGDS